MRRGYRQDTAGILTVKGSRHRSGRPLPEEDVSYGQRPQLQLDFTCQPQRFGDYRVAQMNVALPEVFY